MQGLPLQRGHMISAHTELWTRGAASPSDAAVTIDPGRCGGTRNTGMFVWQLDTHAFVLSRDKECLLN